MKIKLPVPKFKISFALIVNLLLALVILTEVYFVYSVLYNSLDPEPTEIILNRIVKVDLKAYKETSELLEFMESYTPGPLNIQNTDPFRYND